MSKPLKQENQLWQAQRVWFRTQHFSEPYGKNIVRVPKWKIRVRNQGTSVVKTLTPRLKFPCSTTFFMARIFSCNDHAARIIVPNRVFPIEVRPLPIPHSMCANFSSEIAGWDLWNLVIVLCITLVVSLKYSSLTISLMVLLIKWTISGRLNTVGISSKRSSRWSLVLPVLSLTMVHIRVRPTRSIIYDLISFQMLPDQIGAYLKDKVFDPDSRVRDCSCFSHINQKHLSLLEANNSAGCRINAKCNAGS